MPRYRVASKHEVLGQAPGTEFEAELPEVQEARLLSGGHLELVDAPAKEPKQKADETE